MRISVVIPVYNAEGTIEETLKGLFQQSRLPEQIIVVDNNSTDRTVKKVKEFMNADPSENIILANEKKKGPSAARNKGVSLSRGDVVAFIDADEIPPRDWIKIIEEELSKDIEAAGGPVVEYATDTFLKNYLDIMQKATIGEREILKADVRNDRFVFAGNLAVKKNLFFQVGKFDEEMKTGEDIDLSKRIYKAGKPIIYNPEMAAIHNHKETFRGRFEKAFGYGLLQAMFLDRYFEAGLSIVFSSKKRISFRFPFKVRLQLFSIFIPLLLLYLINLFNSHLAIALITLFILGINFKTAQLVIKSGKKLNPFSYLLFLLYWSIERLIFDIGRIWGSIKHKVICI